MNEPASPDAPAAGPTASSARRRRQVLLSVCAFVVAGAFLVAAVLQRELSVVLRVLWFGLAAAWLLVGVRKLRPPAEAARAEVSESGPPTA